MIAICVVLHNQLWYTQQFFKSIARNSYPHQLGFFVLDNGSSDGTWEWMNSALHGSPQALLRNAGNDSLSKAWNQVLTAGLAHGADLLCLMNNDVIVGPGWLTPVIHEYQKSDKAYWLANGAVGPENFDAVVSARPRTGLTYPGRAGWCMFFRAETVREFMPISEELRLWYGDDFIHWKLEKAGYRRLVVDDCCVYHYGSKTVQSIGPIQHIIDRDKETYFRLTGERL